MSRDVVASRVASRVERMLVIDVETTGLLNSDRIVEVAAVVLDDRGRIVDEYDTLVTRNGTSELPPFTEPRQAWSPPLQRFGT